MHQEKNTLPAILACQKHLISGAKLTMVLGDPTEAAIQWRFLSNQVVFQLGLKIPWCHNSLPGRNSDP